MKYFWIACGLLMLTVIFTVAVYFYNVSFTVGMYYFLLLATDVVAIPNLLRASNGSYQE